MNTTSFGIDFEMLEKDYLSHVSVDCVLFGFHNGQLKVLLLESKFIDFWSLPGGFVKSSETVEEAASRVLEDRTGIKNIFFRQFFVFSTPTRFNPGIQPDVLNKAGVDVDPNIVKWMNQRFISIGFYALVDYSKVCPKPDYFSNCCCWKNVDELPNLMMDHNQIFTKALETLRTEIQTQPVGYNLLPLKFTMPELQGLYETILGKQLDRRNFQRKMLSYKILNRLPERRLGVAHKAPFLYQFDKEKYNHVLETGYIGGW